MAFQPRPRRPATLGPPSTRYPLPATRYFSTLIDRTKVILQKLESDDSSIELPSAATPKAKPKKKITVTPADDSQLGLF